jgi:SIR2-like domain
VFDLAADLADGVGAAIVELLVNAYRRQTIEARRAATAEMRRRVSPMAPSSVYIPPYLMGLIERQSVVLFAGPDLSTGAGLPSATFLAQHLQNRMIDPERNVESSAPALDWVINEFVDENGREALRNELQNLGLTFSDVGPTLSHRVAVRTFDTILNSAFDSILSRTAIEEGTGHTPIEPESAANYYHRSSMPAREVRSLPKVILQLRGNMEQSDSALLTSEDFTEFRINQSDLWRAMVRRMSTSSRLLVVGTSPRDPILGIVARARQHYGASDHNWIVLPERSHADVWRCKRYGFEVIEGGTDAFFEALASGASRNR